MPERASELIIKQNMIEVGFVAKTYDIEAEGPEGKTEIRDWYIKEANEDGILLKIDFL